MRISDWRKELKESLLWRDTYCYCGKPLVRGVNIDMHEGLVSRGQMMGWPEELKLLTFNELNCILICHTCNIMNPPSRKRVWDDQQKRYGDELEKWYRSLCGLVKGKMQNFT